MKQALLLGTFEKKVDTKTTPVLTPSAAKFDAEVKGQLTKLIAITGSIGKGSLKTFYDVSDKHPIVSVVGLGPEDAGFDPIEEVNEKRENIRGAVSVGVRALRDAGSDIEAILVDDMTDAEAAAEGGVLGLFYYDELKSEKYKKKVVSLNLYDDSNSTTKSLWEQGVILANGQNIARKLAETPANKMTPTIFATIAQTLGKEVGVEVIAHDRKWAEDMKMGSFLSVANGSDEPCVFLEVKYNNIPTKTQPLVFVGKGITFDTGGISIKPASNMDQMRGDMAGGAMALATILTLATARSNVNVVGLIPLTENMPSGKATKPGDVVTASNGKTIQVDNTDAEGRLVLADGLHYAHQFDPQAIISLATLTGAIRIALGSACSSAYATNTAMFNQLHDIGIETGDRVWRMPLWNHYSKQVTNSQLADTLNTSKAAGAGGSCTAAAFLKEFVTHPKWIHMDLSGVRWNDHEISYLATGMAGRPVRTLVKFVQQSFASAK